MGPRCCRVPQRGPPLLRRRGLRTQLRRRRCAQLSAPAPAPAPARTPPPRAAVARHGAVLALDAAGELPRLGHAAPPQRAWALAADDAARALGGAYGARLLAALVRGSAARGEAVRATSDLDLVAVVAGEGASAERDAAWASALAAQLSVKHARLATKVEVRVVRVVRARPCARVLAASALGVPLSARAAREAFPDAGERFVLAAQCVPAARQGSAAGRKAARLLAALPDSDGWRAPPQPAVALTAVDQGARERAALAAAGRGDAAAAAWLARRAVRALGRAALAREGKWSAGLVPCAEAAKAAGLAAAQDLDAAVQMAVAPAMDESTCDTTGALHALVSAGAAAAAAELDGGGGERRGAEGSEGAHTRAPHWPAATASLARVLAVTLLAAAGLDAPEPARPPPPLGVGVAEAPLAESAESARGDAYVLRGAASGGAFAAPRAWSFAALAAAGLCGSARRSDTPDFTYCEELHPAVAAGAFVPPSTSRPMNALGWVTRSASSGDGSAFYYLQAALTGSPLEGEAAAAASAAAAAARLSGGRGTQPPRAWCSRAGYVSTLHYDASDSLLVQLRGEKTVAIWPRASLGSLRPYPDSHPLRRRCRADPRLPVGAPGGVPTGGAGGRVATLRPGDVLVLPAGCAHWTRSDTASISMTARFEAARQLEEEEGGGGGGAGGDEE